MTPTPSFTMQVKGIINNIEDLDNRISAIAITDATSYLTHLSGHSPINTIQKVQDEINKANANLQTAKIDINNENFHRAIMHYKEAWSHAEMALKVT